MKKLFIVFALVLMASCGKKAVPDTPNPSASDAAVDLSEDTTPTEDVALPADATAAVDVATDATPSD
jgi:hypothetical protein